MKSIYRVIAIWSCWLVLNSLARAQEGSSSKSFVTLVNVATAGSDRLHMKVNGKTIYEPGYSAGQYTGCMVFDSGTLKVELVKEGCFPAERTLSLAAGKTTTLIVYAEEIFEKDTESSLGFQLRLATLPQKTVSDGVGASFVSFLLNEEVSLKVKDLVSKTEIRKVLNPLKREDVLLSGGGETRAQVSVGGQYVGSIKTKTNGNRVAILWRDEKEKLRLINFYDAAYSVSEKGN